MAGRTRPKPDGPTQAQANKFDMLSPMLDSLLNEMRELSKKKQDGVINTVKVKMINRLLRDVKEILGTDPSTAYLDLLDEEGLPQNSDAVLILGQFQAAMKQFQDKHYRYDPAHGGKRWFTQD